MTRDIPPARGRHARPNRRGGGAGPGRHIAGAVGLQLIARAVGTLASVVTVAVTTRHLGVEGYGLLTTAVVFVGLWSSLTELGVSAVIVRKVTGGTGDLAELVGVNLGLSLAYCVPLTVLAAGSGLAVYHSDARVHGVLLVVCVSLLLGAIANCFQPIFMTSVRFGAVALSDIVCRLATLAATLAVIAGGGGLVWFGAVQLVPPAVQIVLLGVAAYRIEPFRARFDRSTSLAVLRESLPQTGVLIVGALYWRADAVILTLLGTTRDVGAYGIAYTVAFTLSVLCTFFLASSLSTMTALAAGDRTSFARFIGSGMESMLFLGMPIAAFGLILSRPLIALLGTGTFAAVAATPLALLLVGVALTFLTGVLSQALFAARDQTFLLRLNLVNLAVNIVLNVILAPRYGAVGSASALVVSEATGLLVASWRLSRICPYATPWSFLLRLCVPLGCGAVVALAMRHLPVLAVIPVVGAVYALVNLITGPVRIDTVRGLLGRSGPTAQATP